MNAANEVAVAAFLAGRLAFLGIADLVERVMDEHLAGAWLSDDGLTVEAVAAADHWGAQRARQIAG
jgi:1-deoxy-D-xylulose-5-phosphate reductoisomerase